jgi:hypothetical protein
VEHFERCHEPSDYIKRRNLVINGVPGGWYSVCLRAGRYGVRTLVEARGSIFSAPVQTGPGAHPASSVMDTGYQGVALTTQPYLAPRIGISRAVHLLPVCASYDM